MINLVRDFYYYYYYYFCKLSLSCLCSCACVTHLDDGYKCSPTAQNAEVKLNPSDLNVSHWKIIRDVERTKFLLCLTKSGTQIGCPLSSGPLSNQSIPFVFIFLLLSSLAVHGARTRLFISLWNIWLDKQTNSDICQIPTSLTGHTKNLFLDWMHCLVCPQTTKCVSQREGQAECTVAQHWSYYSRDVTWLQKMQKKQDKKEEEHIRMWGLGGGVGRESWLIPPTLSSI